MRLYPYVHIKGSDRRKKSSYPPPHRVSCIYVNHKMSQSKLTQCIVLLVSSSFQDRKNTTNHTYACVDIPKKTILCKF